MENSDRTPFHANNEFPILKELCDNWQIIQQEFSRLDPPVMNVNRASSNYYDEVIENVKLELQNGNDYGWIIGWGKEKGNDSWLQYGLMCYDDSVNAVIESFIGTLIPKTLGMLKKIRGIRVCAFTKLKAHSIIPYHRHPEHIDESILLFHLPIITAQERNYTYLNVMGEFKQYQQGEPIIFDGSFDHFVVNESDVDRIILYVEFKSE